MKYHMIILGIVLDLLVGCKQVENHDAHISLRDSIIEKHLSEVEAVDGYDTTQVNYQFLKAYLANDTSRLLTLNKLTDIEKTDREESLKRDSCLHIIPLKRADIIEAYRFDYWEAFCSNQVNITVVKKQDHAYLHFVLYKPKMILKSEYIIIKEYDKTIHQQEWNTFSSLLNHSDFWGLKATNDVEGFDGDGLTVVGYKRNYLTASKSMKSNRVYRWSVNSSTLADPYYYLLTLAGGKDTCNDVL